MKRGLLALLFSAVGLQAAHGGLTPFSDDFNACSLDDLAARGWMVVDPLVGLVAVPATEEVLGGGSGQAFVRLSMPANTSYDSWSDIGNAALQILQPVAPGNSFEVEAGFLSVPVDAFDLQGLIFIEDQDSFARADFFRDGSGNMRVFFGTQDGSDPASDRIPYFQPIIPEVESAFLRVTYDGANGEWRLFTSADGVNYTRRGAGVEVQFPLDIVSMGVAGGNPLEANDYVADIDFFRNVAEPFLPAEDSEVFACPVCGDGVRETGEECDDGDDNSDSQPDACRTDCRVARCGDHVQDGQEQCDDGNEQNGDGCQANCRIAVCGDEIIDPLEECDDGNVVDGDGCDARCRCQDADGDGFTYCSGDCDEADPGAHPNGFESCDGRDNDCDGPIDNATECYGSFDRFVGPSGSDTGNDCSESSMPCATVAHAIEVAQAGDDVLMLAGLYTEQDVVVDKEIVVEGQGQGQTIIQAASAPGLATGRVFVVGNQQGLRPYILIANLTIRHGVAGLFFYGVPTQGGSITEIHDVTIEANAGAGAIVDATAEVTFRGCTIQDNAGDGISAKNFSSSPLVLQETTLRRNDGNGLSLSNLAEAFVIDSTISENSGHGIRFRVDSFRVQIVNSTISRNTVGLNLPDASAVVLNSTITENQFGVSLFTPLPLHQITLRNTVIAGNAILDCEGGNAENPNSNLGNNLFGLGSGCEAIAHPADMFVPSSSVFASVLGELGRYGGTTRSHPLLQGSPAIDNGNPAGCEDLSGAPLDRDQTGAIRPIDGNGDGVATCDIGSVEFQCSDRDDDGFSACAGDCDDFESAVNPDALERCNAIDDDCDELVDEDEVGEDTDTDGIHNLCDNCLLTYNLSQSDTDQDLEGDHCDTDDGQIYLRTDDPDHVQWDDEEGYASWNLYRGDLTTLAATGGYTQLPGSNALAGQACALGELFYADPTVPDPGRVAFYLISGNDGAEGDLGRNGAGELRPNDHPCPPRDSRKR